VKRGDLLIELDPRDFEVNLASAQSKLAEAEAQQSVARAGLGQTRADLARAQAGRPTGNQCTLTRFLDMISKRMSIAFRLEPVTASLWLPAGNATGNFVKVVQRVPVKIVFDEPSGNLDRLWAGESVEPRVHVDAPGARESLANPLPRQFWVRGREMRGER
jgi:multidrug resistance efflux pump